jgi:hypothetical protein
MPFSDLRDRPLGVSLCEKPAGIHVLRLWRKAMNYLTVSLCEKPAGIHVLRLWRKAMNLIR